MEKKTTVGGQAVIEGVMMRGTKGLATAVRLPNGNIEIKTENSSSYTKKNKILGLPLIRGFVSLIESLIVGIKSLEYSASFFEDEEEEESKFDKWFDKTFKDKGDSILMGISLVLSLTFSVILFFILPTTLASLMKKYVTDNALALNILEGVIRVLIFLTYIVLIGKMKDIYRLYQYHGAEHKTIFCYENGIDLTPENAQKFGRLHPRCGTNFMFLVMVISIIIFSFTGWESLGQRVVSRILLLPLVSGVTYEIIRWLGKSDSTISKIIAWPGLLLQKITTKEPDEKMLEVAIASLKAAEGLE
ncbi:MAG: DUF1385 domain-containing protein [Clostridium sp.]|uniref:DUF1385 domain-containing protein n=1 Tax=Clostridium culturomicium TaxID=1499683 RepID=UPI000590C1C8|nr:DUF1385 domain-containing protein [Clostridium culturomicium]MDU4892393.1 DUF1385 domain-containing protein [Clostridium sp.]MDU7085767.1 DUF1385 domain-containing protein [Clostridium sp.]